MRTRGAHLRILASPREATEQTSVPEQGDLALMAMLLGVNLVPLIGEAARAGRWGAGTVGFATASALVAGRELWLEVRELARARKGAAR